VAYLYCTLVQLEWFLIRSVSKLQIYDSRHMYRDVDKSLARPGGKQARKHVRDARDFNNIETRAVIKSPPPPTLQGKAPKEIHAILIETLACFLPSRAKDLSAPLYFGSTVTTFITVINPLNAELNPICHLLALLGAHHILHFRGLRVKNVLTALNVGCVTPRGCVCSSYLRKYFENILTVLYDDSRIF